MNMRQRRRAIAHSPRRQHQAHWFSLRQHIKTLVKATHLNSLIWPVPVFAVRPDFGVIAIDSACA